MKFNQLVVISTRITFSVAAIVILHKTSESRHIVQANKFEEITILVAGKGGGSGGFIVVNLDSRRHLEVYGSKIDRHRKMVKVTTQRIAQKAFKDRKSTRLNSSHHAISRMPSSA